MDVHRAVLKVLSREPTEDEAADKLPIPDVVGALEHVKAARLASASRAVDALGVDGPQPPPAHSLVAIAEVAVRKREEYGVAEEAVRLFLGTDPPADQFLARALLVRGLVEAQSSAALQGIDAVHHLQAAMASVTQALDVATADDNKARYAFLVYQASVYMWWVARRLLHTGTRKYAVAPLERVAAALETTADVDVRWRARLAVTIAVCHEEAGAKDKAVAAAGKALALAKQVTDAAAGELVEEVRRVNVHLARHDPGKAMASAKDDGKDDARAKPLLELQAMLSGAGPQGTDAEAALVAVVAAVSPSTKALYDVAKGEPDGGAGDLASPGSDVSDPEVLAVAARVATRNQLFLLADTCLECAARTRGGVPPRAKVLADMAAAELTAAQFTVAQAHAAVGNTRAGEGGLMDRIAAATGTTKRSRRPKALPTLDVAAVAAAEDRRKVDALKLADRSLQNAQAVGDASLVEEACALIWNLALPLLQPNTRMQAYRALSNAATALAGVQSTWLALRVRLHYEVARCELSADFLAKASEQLEAALALDYGSAEVVAPDVAAATGKDTVESQQRPLDRFMASELAKLTLRSNLYEDPEGNLDQATLVLQQASDARDSHVARTLVNRAAKMLVAAAEEDAALAAVSGGLVAPPEGKAGDEEGTEEVGTPAGDTAGAVGKRYHRLWVDACKLAWKHRDTALVTKGAGVVLGVSWDVGAAREMVLAQADVHLLCAQAAVADLNALPAPAGAEDDLGDDDGDDDATVDEEVERAALALEETRTKARLATGATGTDADLAAGDAVKANPHTPGLIVDATADATMARSADLKQAAIAHCCHAAALGVKLSADWVASRAAATLWNAHVAVITANVWDAAVPELPPALTTCLDAMVATGVADAALLAQYALGAAAAEEALGMEAAVGGDAAAAAAHFDAAVAHCDRLLSPSSEVPAAVRGACRPALSKPLVAVSARVKVSKAGGSGAAAAAAAGAPDNPLAKVTCLLAAATHGEVGEEDRKAAALAAVAVMPEVEQAAGLGGAEDADAAPPAKGKPPPAKGKPAKGKGGAPPADDAPKPPPKSAAMGAAEAARGANEALGLVAEAWAHVTRACLDARLLKDAQRAAAAAVRLMPDTEARRGEVGPLLWKWVALAECLWGQAVAALVDRTAQTRPVQDDISRAAVGHLAAAARWASEAKDAPLALCIARNLAVVCAPLAASAVTRPSLTGALRAALAALAACNEATDLDLRVALYRLLLRCLADAELWHDGLEVAAEAFQLVPAAKANALWPDRIVFMSRLGQDVVVGLNSMKESQPAMQAKVWLSLARSSGLPSDQLAAYGKAVSVLEGMFGQAQARLELGEWMYAHRFAVEDATDQLLAAADIVVQALEPGEADVGGGDASTMISGTQSRASFGGRSSRAPSTRGGASTVRTGGGSSTVAPPATVASRSARTKSTIGGSSPAAPTSDWPTRVEVGHLETLVRIMAGCARMAPTLPDRCRYSLLAAHYADLMYGLTVSTLNTVAAEREYFSLSAGDRSRVTNFDAWVLARQRAGPFRAPASPADWLLAAGDVDADLVTALGAVPGSWAPYALTTEGIHTPALTLDHLEYVAGVLCEAGYTAHVGPVLAIGQLVADTLVSPPVARLSAVWHLRAAKWLRDGGDVATADARAAAAGDLDVHEPELRAFREDVEVREAQADAPAAASTATKRLATTAEGRRRSAAAQAGGLVGGLPAVPRRAVAGVELRRVWLQHATLAVAAGEHVAAKRLLAEIVRHSRAFGDTETEWRCAVLRGRILCLEGEHKDAVQAVLRAQALQRSAPAPLWLDSVTSVAAFLTDAGRHQDARTVIGQALEAFESAVKAPVVTLGEDGEPPAGRLVAAATTGDVDAVVAAALCRVELGKALAADALALRNDGMVWGADWELVEAAFAKACDVLQAVGAVGHAVTALLSHAEWVLALPGGDPFAGGCGGDRLEAANARVAAIRHAMALLRRADAAAGAWLASTAPPELPPVWVLPAAAAGVTVKRRLCAVGALLGGEVASAAAEADAAIMATADPVTRFLHVEEAAAADPGFDAVAPSLPQACLVAATDAHQLGAGAPAVVHGCNAALGGALRLVASAHHGMADAVWARREVKLPPPPPEAPPDAKGGKGGKGKPPPKKADKGGKGKGKGKGKGGEAAAEAPPEAAIVVPEPVVVPGLSLSAAHLSSQAQHVLMSAVLHGVAAGDVAAAGAAALHMVECLGTAVPGKAVGFLALAQACRVVQDMRRLLTTAASPRSRLRLFLRQQEYLEGANPTAAASLPQHQRLAAFVGGHTRAGAMLDVSAGVEAVLQSVPTGTRLVVLESNGCGVVYVGVIARVAPPAGEAEDEPGAEADDGAQTEALPADIPNVVATVRRVALSHLHREQLGDLVRETKAFRVAAAGFLLNYGEDEGGAGDTVFAGRKPSEADAGEEEAKEGGEGEGEEGEEADMEPSVPRPPSPSTAKDTTHAQFCKLVETMNAVMGCVLGDPDVEAVLDGRGPVVLLPDATFAQLPLEALSILADKDAVTRDFSAHFLANRVRVSQTAADPEFEAEEGPDGAAAVPPVSLHSLAAFADPRCEDARVYPPGMEQPKEEEEPPAAAAGKGKGKPAGKGKGKPGAGAAAEASARPETRVGTPARATVEESVVEAGRVFGATSWQVVRGSGGVATAGQWQRSLVSPDTTGLVFYGPGPCLSYVEPEYVVGIDAASTRFALLLDGAVNGASSRRLARLGNARKAGTPALDGPLETAALLSLAGVGVVVCNQWASTFTANDRLLHGVLGAAAGGEGGTPLATAVRSAAGATVDAPGGELRAPKPRVRFNPVVYGLPQLAVTW